MERMRQLRIWLTENRRRTYMAVVVLAITAAILLFCRYGENDELVWDSGKESTSTKASSADSGEETSNDADGSVSSKSEILYVDIEGEVVHPGVYTADSKTRVFEIIEKAGGFTANADASLINQAELISDGEKITVPAKGEGGGTGESGAVGTNQSTESSGGNNSTGKININTAGLDQLQQIPGVGPATAQKILEYRSTNGRFKKTEDLKNISGIGEKTFEKMRGCIVV